MDLGMKIYIYSHQACEFNSSSYHLCSFVFRPELNMTSEILLSLDVLLEVLYQLKVTLFFINFLSFIMFLSLITCI
jgi:hypothetical protein